MERTNWDDGFSYTRCLKCGRRYKENIYSKGYCNKCSREVKEE